MEIDELARYAREFFETGTRPDGESFWTLTDRYPTWVHDMAQEAHGEMFPDDYKYEYVVDVLDSLEDGTHPDEPALEPDVYNTDRLKWLSSHLERAGFVDEAVENFGHSDQGVLGDIGFGQLYEKEQVWGTVVQQLRERLDEIEQEEPETFNKKASRRSKRGSRKHWDP